jgi:peptidylprolyl isomerase
MTEPVKAGDTIRVNYTGRLENGEVFDTSVGNDPLTFTVCSGQLIQGFDTAVIGMVPGDSKTVTIEADEGYGLRNEEMVVDFPKSAIPADMEMEIGMQVELMDQHGNPVPAEVAEILEDVLKMDLNHPLAGKTLVFEIEVVETGLEPGPLAAGCGCDCNCGNDKGGCGC